MPVTQHSSRFVHAVVRCKRPKQQLLQVHILMFLLITFVNNIPSVQALNPSPLIFPTTIIKRATPPGSTDIITTTISTTPCIAQVHRQYENLPEGKHWNERVSIDCVVQEVKQTSPRLVFLRVQDARNYSNNNHDDDDENNRNDDDDNNFMELLLRERDGFLSSQEIETIKTLVAQPGAILHCCGFPEKLSTFDGPSFFLHHHQQSSSSLSLVANTNAAAAAAAAAASSSSTVLCLHIVAANVTTAEGHFLPVCPIEKQTTTKLFPGRMPPLDHHHHQQQHQQQQKQPGQRSNNSRGGRRNRGRGAIFAAWALETFAFVFDNSNSSAGGRHQYTSILDVAGGAGQLAFEFGVRRGINTTVIDPRPLQLALGQQRTLEYHRETGLRLLPHGRDVSLPAFDYGHHFCEISSNNNGGIQRTTAVPNETTTSMSDRTWLVGGGARVRHLSKWFDMDFGESDIWRESSLVLGMHPDEATEDLVDLALAHDKPFAVVPCCVFWRRDPHRKTPTGKAVRNWEQFCEYLAAKDDQRIKVTTLPISGRNVVLYSLGSESNASA